MNVQRRSPMIRFLIAAGGTVMLALACLLAPSQSNAQSIEVLLNAEPIPFQAEPIIVEGTTLVQFRPLFEAMDLRIEWDNDTKTITGTNEELSLTLQIDNKQATVNGLTFEMLQAPQIVNGYTMVPIRFISESTGAIVVWNPYVPEVVIFTETFWVAHGLSREELEDDIRQAIEKIREQNESQEEPENSDVGVEQPRVTEPVDLNLLQGMYVGYRIDRGGYECGGLCADIYTFLPDQKVVIGLPENGGPENINCERDNCQTYTIQNGQMMVNGETYVIAVEDGELFINDISMTPVVPVGNDLKLSNTYEHVGYYGQAGFAGYSRSWTFTYDFHSDGTFVNDVFRIGSMDAGAAFAQGHSTEEGSGTYTIDGNTLTLTYDDGKVEHLLIFEDDDTVKGEFEGLQIGDLLFYVEGLFD